MTNTAANTHVCAAAGLLETRFRDTRLCQTLRNPSVKTAARKLRAFVSTYRPHGRPPAGILTLRFGRTYISGRYGARTCDPQLVDIRLSHENTGIIGSLRSFLIPFSPYNRLKGIRSKVSWLDPYLYKVSGHLYNLSRCAKPSNQLHNRDLIPLFVQKVSGCPQRRSDHVPQEGTDRDAHAEGSR